ncbi:MAG: ThiF family adenylyltransferase [Planctomycetales bacterium]|nr:ThiF family adenylyltransferase [Planctomycetales bacterium]
MRKGKVGVSEVLRVDHETGDGRFSRFELISWWDQRRLSEARVLVIGAGALGNEQLKNLALLGIGNVFIADLDRIENSNLSRSILFRSEDCGRSKAEVAAERLREIYPDMRLQSFHGNIVYDLGLGVYRWADIILGGLDNREARVAINQAAARVGKPWIDGAIERLDGVARVFDPAIGPCYECTMSEVDWKMLEARRSCALLTREEMEQAKVPTTPTTSSVIAGIQTQEAVKMLHGLETLSGQGFVYDGRMHNSYVVTYSRLQDCPSHDAYAPIETLDLRVGDTTVGDFLQRLQKDLGGSAVIEFNHDLLESLTCSKCDTTEPMLASLGKVSESQGRCPDCGQPRTPNVYHTIGPDSKLLNHTLAELGVPRWDILGGRVGMEQKFYEFAGDREILGELAHTTSTAATRADQEIR